MKAAVIVFPGANCDRDLAVALRGAGIETSMVWHKDAELPAGIDLVGLPGGFSYGDYLRCGAIAARSPICAAVARHAARGGYLLGICNGFQVLTELGLLPGALMRNRDLRFICREAPLIVENVETAFTSRYETAARIRIPVAHHDGCWIAGEGDLHRLEGEGRIAFRYDGNPNGSEGNVAGVLSPNGRVLGMMPHPERAADAALGGTDGARLFAGLAGSLQSA